MRYRPVHKPCIDWCYRSIHGFWYGLYQHPSLYREIVKVTWRVFNQLNVFFLFWYAITWYSEGHVKSVQPIKSILFILICNNLIWWRSRAVFNQLNVCFFILICNNQEKYRYDLVFPMHCWHILHTSIGVMKWDIYDPIIIWKLKRLNMPTERAYIPICRK